MASNQLIQEFQGPVTSSLHGARIHYWPSSYSLKPAATLLFVPGNPGLADYYIEYLTALHRIVNNEGVSLEIVCPSQLGHDPLSLTLPSTLVSLDEQVENKARILETLTNRWAGTEAPKVILAGHSIGAWMVLELVRRGLNKTSVTSIHLLFPALHQMGQTPNAKKLSWLLGANSQPSHLFSSLLVTILGAIVYMVLKIVQILPLPIVHFLVLVGAPSQPPSAVRTTTNFILTLPCVQQALTMGKEEMALVREVQNLPRSHSTGPDLDVKLRAYWAAGDIDGWAPEKTRKVVERTLGMQSYNLPWDILDKSSEIPPFQKSLRKHKGYSIDEIRRARLSKRRALAGMVRAGASASYGLASSLTNLGYRRPGTNQNNQASLQQQRPMRRRPSLMAAKASRRFDGSIYIEPSEEGTMEDLLSAKDEGDVVEGAVFSSRPLSLNSKLGMPSRASIVCKQGFKHAFVLEHSEQMARISAAMLVADVNE